MLTLVPLITHFYILLLHTYTSVKPHCSYTPMNDETATVSRWWYSFWCASALVFVQLVGFGMYVFPGVEETCGHSGARKTDGRLGQHRLMFLASIRRRSPSLGILGLGTSASSTVTSLWWFPWQSRKGKSPLWSVVTRFYLFTYDFLSPFQIERFVYPLSK